MDAATIKENIRAIRARMIPLQMELEAEQAKLRVLQRICDHPDGYPTSCMGDTGFYCPDCGYSR